MRGYHPVRERFRASIAVFQPLSNWRNIVLLAGVQSSAMF